MKQLGTLLLKNLTILWRSKLDALVVLVFAVVLSLLAALITHGNAFRTNAATAAASVGFSQFVRSSGPPQQFSRAPSQPDSTQSPALGSPLGTMSPGSGMNVSDGSSKQQLSTQTSSTNLLYLYVSSSQSSNPAVQLTGLQSILSNFVVALNGSFSLGTFSSGASNPQWFTGGQTLATQLAKDVADGSSHCGAQTALCIGVEFESTSPNFQYFLRPNGDSVPDTTLMSISGEFLSCTDATKCPDAYPNNGIVQVQTAMDQAIGMYVANSQQLTFGAVSFNRLGFSQTISMSTMFTVLALVVPVLFAFLPLYRYIAAKMVDEKQCGMKRVLVLAGMSMGNFFASWFILFFFVLLLVVAVVVLIILFATLSTPLIQYGTLRGYFFALTFFYAMNIWSVSFLISAVCKRTSTASTVAIYAALVMSLLYMVVPFTRPYGIAFTYGLPLWLICILMVVPAFTFSLGLDLIYFTEILRGGQLEATLAPISMQAFLATLAVEFLLYLAVALILEHYLSEEYGSPAVSRADRQLESECCGERAHPPQDFEAVSNSVSPVIQIRGLWKIYKVGKSLVRAVRGVNLDIYENQITCILGHNGAGKSTMIDMMTGLLRPTKGYVKISGKDVRTTAGANVLHGNIGICFQQAAAYKSLSVMEHLRILARLKGITCTDESLLPVIDEVGLSESCNVSSHNLSGGQRRRLNLAMALLGDPKVLFLDEPTTGIDPVSRRAIWKILDCRRARHAIVLTTHYMDEADFVADRKAIMSFGTIRCSGTSLFLKHKFGIGYHLNFELKNMPPQSAIMCRNVIVAIVQGHIGEYKIQVDTPRYLSFTLPFAAIQRFPQLFDDIDSFRANPQSCNLTDAGIRHYSVDPTTLEEVFLRLARESAEEGADERSNSHDNEGYENETDAQGGSKSLKSLNYWLSRSEKPTRGGKWCTLFKLRVRMLCNDWLTTLAGILLAPIASAILAGLYIGFANNYTDVGYNGPTLALTLNSYAAPYNAAPSTDLYAVAFDDRMGNASFQYFAALMNSGPQNVLVNLLPVQDPQLNNSVGISWNGKDTTQLWYRENSMHSPVSAANIFSNFMMRKLFGVGTYNITVGISPIGTNLQQAAAARMTKGNTMSFQVPISQFLAVAPISFVIIFATVSTLLHSEHHCGAFNQLRCTGVTSTVFWTVQFVVDCIQYLLSFVLVAPALAIVIAIAGVQAQYDSNQLAIAALLIILYMPVAFLFLYLLVLAMRNKSTALLSFIVTAVYFPFPAIAACLLQLELLASDVTQFLTPYYIFLLFPNLILYDGLSAISYAPAVNTGVSLSFGNYFAPANAVLWSFIAGLLHLAWEIVALHFVHKSIAERHVPPTCQFGSDWNSSESVERYQMSSRRDSDVVKEEQFVKQAMQSGSEDAKAALLCDNVSLTYKKQGCRRHAEETHAVKNLSMAARQREILGLVGPNGAGKSSSIKIMVGSERATSGELYLAGERVASLSLQDLFDQMSLCTQEDALWPNLTVRQHVEYYAALRGVTGEAIKQLTSRMLKLLHIETHENKKAKQLSGGTKRKVAFAIAMIKTSRMKIILCDEPTSGLDPQSKRVVWNLLYSMFRTEEAQSSSCACLFTSHSMEEIEAVCDRVNVLISGTLQCSGSIQHCKEKFGGCFILDVKTKSVDGMHCLLQYLLSRFPNARALEADVGTHQRISFPRRDVRSLGGVFRMMQGAMNKAAFMLEEYSFGQCALEQVYLDLVKRHVADSSTNHSFGFSNV